MLFACATAFVLFLHVSFMNKYSHKVFLCGHFSYDKDNVEALSGWERLYSDENAKESYSQLFYPEFVRAYLPSEESAHMRHYRLVVGEKVSLELQGAMHELHVKEIVLYLSTYDIAMFSVEVEHETDNLNTVTLVLSLLRSPAFYTQVQDEFVKMALDPVREAYKVLNRVHECPLDDLIENGNKFKAFQIVNAVGEEKEDVGRGMTLFELGTVSRMTPPGEEEQCQTCDEYITRILENNKVAVFKNWRALGLMDTFTIYSDNAAEGLLNVWCNIYFRFIYISQLFQKCYLFSLNKRFRLKSSPVTRLEAEYRNFERECCFNKISYNFLPLEINEAMDKGLEVSEERCTLHETLETEYERRRSSSDKMENALLLVLSLMTTASALWDLTSLMNEVYPYTEHFGTSLVGHRLVVSVAMALIAIMTYFIYKKR